MVAELLFFTELNVQAMVDKPPSTKGTHNENPPTMQRLRKRVWKNPNKQGTKYTASQQVNKFYEYYLPNLRSQSLMYRTEHSMFDVI